MTQGVAFSLINDNILIMLAVLTLLAKILGFILFGRAPGKLKITLLLCKQPVIPASVIILSVFAAYFLNRLDLFAENQDSYTLGVNALDTLRSVASLWLFLGEARAVYLWLSGITEDKPILEALLPYIKNSLYVIGMILALPFLIPDFLQAPTLTYIINKLTVVLTIWALAWLVIEVIVALEKTTLQRFHESLSNDFRARRIYTQARVFKRIAVVVVFVLAVATTLMTFENIREVGTSILASAGLATVVLGFAAQKTLGNLFAGIQIAITQPIRINDTVTLENELGTVEEIALTYVVIRIWDLRRLIVPISYFLEKPFQNLTRNSTNLLCPIVFFADYTLPIEPVRQKFLEIVKASPFWDQRLATLQVTDAKEGTIQLRALASAQDSGSSWNLRCEILEKLLAYISENYPQGLPHVRNRAIT